MKAGLAALAALALLTLSLTACGGSGSAKVSAPAKQYLALVSDLNKAHDQFNKTNDDLDSKTAANSEYAASIKTFVTAIHTFDNAMLAATWPASVQSDVKALAASDDKMVDALEKFAVAVEGATPPDFDGLEADLNAATVDAGDAAFDLSTALGISPSAAPTSP